MAVPITGLLTNRNLSYRRAPNALGVYGPQELPAAKPRFRTRKRKAQRSKEIIDGTGKFLIPGLWSTGLHGSYEDAVSYFSELVSYGITTVRDRDQVTYCLRMRDLNSTDLFRISIVAMT
jgi:hypothetical protein